MMFFDILQVTAVAQKHALQASTVALLHILPSKDATQLVSPATLATTCRVHMFLPLLLPTRTH